jgi:hypothetical protein
MVLPDTGKTVRPRGTGIPVPLGHLRPTRVFVED